MTVLYRAEMKAAPQRAVKCSIALPLIKCSILIHSMYGYCCKKRRYINVKTAPV